MVVHTIFGITTMEDYRWLMDHHYKILILGYKHFRRGNYYFDSHSQSINNIQKDVIDHIDELLKYSGVISFDNLAVQQINLKKYIPDDTWNHLYLGDDGTFTMYIDLYSMTFSTNSTTPVKERHKLKDNMSFEQIFKMIREKNTRK